jgi:hypothetical protein
MTLLGTVLPAPAQQAGAVDILLTLVKADHKRIIGASDDPELA